MPTTDSDLNLPPRPWLRPPVDLPLASIVRNGCPLEYRVMPADIRRHFETAELVRFSIYLEKDIRFLRGKFGIDFIFSVQIEGPQRKFFWSVRESSANWIRLEKILGKNIVAWPGAIVPLELRDEPGRVKWIAVEGARSHGARALTKLRRGYGKA